MMRFIWILVALFRRDRNDYLDQSNERRWMWVQRERGVDALLIIFMIGGALIMPLHAQTVRNGIVWNGPKLTPEQGAAILRDCTACESNHTHPRLVLPAGPVVVIINRDDQASSTPWKFSEPAPARRLDGTLLTDPPTVYTAAPFFPIYILPAVQR